METAFLQLDDIACRRGGRILFSRISLALSPGQAALVAGPNGVGKSSLLRVIAGLLPPFSGSMSRAGAVALADEQVALDRELTLAAALDFWAKLDGATAQQLAAALDALALDHLADIPVRMLSTGQRKRAGIARVIASGAPIWLLDEPINGLDSESCDRLAAAVSRHRENGGILIATSHLDLPWQYDTRLSLQRPHDSEAE